LASRIFAPASERTKSIKARASGEISSLGKTKVRTFVSGYLPVTTFSLVGAIPLIFKALIFLFSEAIAPLSDKPIAN